METKDILKDLREKSGYTSTQVAEGCGISRGVYQSYEYGQRNLGVPALVKIAKFYGVSTDYILGLAPPPNPLAGLRITVNDQSFMSAYQEFPDYVKQIFVDAMRKLAEAAEQEQQPTISVDTTDKEQQKLPETLPNSSVQPKPKKSKSKKGKTIVAARRDNGDDSPHALPDDSVLAECTPYED